VAKNGLHLLNDWPFDFSNETISVRFEDYPDAPQGDMFRDEFGSLRFELPDGRRRYLDIGNVR
jgi:hypothetical protein